MQTRPHWESKWHGALAGAGVKLGLKPFFSRLQQTDRMRDPRRNPRQPRYQFLARAHQFGDRHGRQPVDDEPEIPAVPPERRAFALPPIPPAAGNSQIVLPHDLAGLGIFDHRRAVAHGIEWLVPARHNQPRQTGIAVRIFAAKTGAESDAQRVIKVYHRTDRRQAPVLLDALPQCLHRTGSLLRIRSECPKCAAPRFQVLCHPGWRLLRKRRDGRGIRRAEVPHDHA